MADLAIIMTLKEEELEIDTEISLGNAIPPAYGSTPHPDSLFRLCWDGPAYLVTAGSEVGIYKTW
jgi:hypothetical protein